MILYIKFMVCMRCKLVVKKILDSMGLSYGIIELGQVEIMKTLSATQKKQLSEALIKSGLELIEDRKSILIERIKCMIIGIIHCGNEFPKLKFSVYIAERLHYDYGYLANIFYNQKGISIENFIITHRIERAKELLMYDEISLTEISHKLNYKNVSHLSTQFKKLTGVTPSLFRDIKCNKRVEIDSI